MIHIKQAIVVEGKYDKIKLSSIVDAVILVTNGFQIYKNPEQLERSIRSTRRMYMEKNTAKKNPPQRANSAWKASGKNCCWQPLNGLEFWRKKPLPKIRKNRLLPMTFTRSD